MKRRPTEGDKVRILKTTPPIPPKYAGQIGEITKDDHSACPYLILFNDGGDWWFSESDVEIIVDPPAKPERELKVGDKVRVKSRDWYEANKNNEGYVHIETPLGQCSFNDEMAAWCGKVVTISEEISSCLSPQYKFKIKEDGENWYWSPEMFDLDNPQLIRFDFSDLAKGTIASIPIPSFFVKGSKPAITGNLPLIHKHKLLTNIKLD